MTKYSNQTFENQDIKLSGNEYTHCIFVKCELIYPEEGEPGSVMTFCYMGDKPPEIPHFPYSSDLMFLERAEYKEYPCIPAETGNERV